MTVQQWIPAVATPVPRDKQDQAAVNMAETESPVSPKKSVSEPNGSIAQWPNVNVTGGWNLKSSWIEINEQAPELGERIIVATKNGYVGECCISENGNLYRYDGRNLFKSIFGEIVAWMPMPEPPTGRKKVFDNGNIQ